MPNNSHPDHGHPEVSLNVTVNSNPNANGRNGLEGNNGYRYGESGTDGSRGGDGKDAANLNLTLSHHQNEKGRWVNIADAGVVHWSVQLDSQASISLMARGGDGGRGGKGGNGAQGAPGADGIDATQYSLGTDGQMGGRGGDAGSGGRGGNGGDGGHIRIRLPESSPLLMLIDSVNVRGGFGGSGGDAGYRGMGGPGGYGGAAYRWTTVHRWQETEYRQEQVRDYTYGYDYGYVTRSVPYTVNKEKIIHHKNRGGCNGSVGRPGFAGSSGSYGNSGNAGSYRILLADTGQAYTSIYDIDWIRSVTPHSPDGIIEPGEQLRFIPVLKNVGAMPTPPSYPVIVSLASSDWVQFDPQNEVQIRSSIQPGSEYRLAPGLAYQVKYPRTVAIDHTFSAEGSLAPMAHMSLVNKRFPKVEGEVNFPIRYPVEVSMIAGANAVAFGEQAPVTMWVRNISNQAIGSDSQTGRLLRLQFMQAGTTSTSGLVFKSRACQSRHVMDSAYGINIPNLRAGECMAVSGTLEFTNPLTAKNIQVQLQAHLSLGTINRPARETQKVQIRSSAIQLAETYQFDANADVVLVVNSAVSAAQIASWKSTLRAFGLRLNVWNVSLYGGVDYQYVRDDGGSFWSQLQGKVLVFLNKSYSADTLLNKKRSTDFLGTAELFEAARRQNIATCIIGEGFHIHHAISALHNHPSTKHESKAELLSALDAVAGQTDAASPARYDHYPVHTRTLFNVRPSHSHTKDKAKSLYSTIDERYPQMQHQLVSFVDKKKISSGIKGTKWQVGHVQVRQGLYNTRAHIASQHYKDENMDIVRERDLFLAIKLLPFQKKLNLIPAVLQNNHSVYKQNSNILLKAILSDLADECRAFSKHKWSGSYNKTTIEGKLTVLKALCDHDFSNIAQDQKGHAYLRLLFGKYKRMVKQLPGLKDKTIRDGSFAKRRGFIVSKFCKASINQLITDYLGIPREKFKREEKTNKVLWMQWDNEPKLRGKKVMIDCARPKQFCNHNTLFSTHRSTSPVRNTDIAAPGQNTSDIKEGRYKFTGSNANNDRISAISGFERKAAFDSNVPIDATAPVSFFN